VSIASCQVPAKLHALTADTKLLMCARTSGCTVSLLTSEASIMPN
jgi:hypothetical protein